MCGCVTEIDTNKQTRVRRRKVETETEKKKKQKQTVRQVDRESESLKDDRERDWHDTLPPFPLKSHLLLTDEKHNASVTWTLICSSYLSKSSAFPELIKTDKQEQKDGDRQQNIPEQGLFNLSHLKDPGLVNLAFPLRERHTPLLSCVRVTEEGGSVDHSEISDINNILVLLAEVVMFTFGKPLWMLSCLFI